MIEVLVDLAKCEYSDAHPRPIFVLVAHEVVRQVDVRRQWRADMDFAWIYFSITKDVPLFEPQSSMTSGFPRSSDNERNGQRYRHPVMRQLTFVIKIGTHRLRQRKPKICIGDGYE